MYRGIVVLDVDGVIFRDIFLKKIVASRGPLKHFRIIRLGMKYYREKISIDTLLQEGYKLAGNFSAHEAKALAGEIKRTTNVSQAVEILREKGFYISLISSGIPNFILESLAKELNADHYSGLDISTKRGTLVTGNLNVISKTAVVEDLMKKLGFGWDNVFSVGDDPGNITLLKKSKVGIGFNPVKSVRRNADVVIEGNNFLEILPYILPKEELPGSVSISRLTWKRELFRKAVHFTGSAVPFFAAMNKKVTVIALISIIAVYIISELLRTFGLSLSLLSAITRKAQRHSEKTGIIMGPVLLGLGIAVTISLFTYEIYLPAILVVAISDSLSALVGRRFGKVPIFGMRNRTVEGSLAFFFSALLILRIFYPLPVALLATFVATALELVPFFNIDNLLIPIGTSLFLWAWHM